MTEPKYDPAKWKVVMPRDDPRWLEKSEAPVAWDASHFYIGFATSMAQRLPKVAAFLSNIDFTPEEITEHELCLAGRPAGPGQIRAGLDRQSMRTG